MVFLWTSWVFQSILLPKPCGRAGVYSFTPTHGGRDIEQRMRAMGDMLLARSPRLLRVLAVVAPQLNHQSQESHQGEAPRGSSHQREEPQRDTPTAHERWYRSSPGSPEEEHGAEHDAHEPYFEAEEDEIMEEAAAVWEGEIVEDDEMIDRVTSSASATDPWFLYEAGIICSRQADGSVELNSSGERVINLREWAYLLSHQRIKLRKEIKRPEWEKLPWTGHLCYLFTRAWEIGRAKSQFKRDKDYARMRDFSQNVKQSGSDWMRGQGPPNNWENRFNIPMNSWHETWLNYQGDHDIQEDMEWLSEAVFQFYQVHLDRMIRKNELLWGDFCKPKYHWNEVKEEYEKYLDLNMAGFDLTDPTTVVTPTPKTVIPEPEKHFSFTTILMVMAIELYQEESERKFCQYVTYADQQLVNFVESRKQMTTESYKFFIEHAYNQFVTQSAFHTSARAKTKAKDITGHGITHVSTKLSGYVWIGSQTKLVHIPEDQAFDVTMGDVAGDDTDRRADVLPRLEFKIEREDAQEPLQVEDVQEEVQQEPMEGVGSPQGEETQEEPGDSAQPERPEFPPGNFPQERHGNYIMSQISVQEFLELREWVFNLTSGLSEQERREQRLPMTPDDVSTMAISMFMEVLAIETHSGFMSAYPQFTQTDVDPDNFHAIQLSCKRVKKENEHITITSFEEEDSPEIPEDPESKKGN